ncbi:unnamed protein product [Allacma fusca]|uniref:Reverse transcriptase domain-containing protein n=1 Tax=Allacma fusca TaxID=39272 RepID=A0A8J2J786_9HEXA|nr:unnamed protein product [Allacma fusca]
MSKLFTTVIQNRLYKWCEEKNILPESQAGFRKKRGCEDQMFCLNALIQSRLSRNAKLHVLFVDFKRAFDSVRQEILWEKMNNLGISAKIINILRSLYDNANLIVRCEEGLTKPIPVTMGYFKGKSPLLFSIYISDLENYMEENGASPVNVGKNNKINQLLFADDTCVPADTKIGLQKKINIKQILPRNEP